MKNVLKLPYYGFGLYRSFFDSTMQNVDRVPEHTNQTLYYSTDFD